MNIADYDFNLPEHLIAQTPLTDRTSSRLLVLNKTTNKINHESFFNIKNYFKKGDCLVLNDTRVLPARMHGVKKDTGAKIEILLLHEQEDKVWEALVKPAKKIKKGDVISFGDGKLTAICVEEGNEGARVFQLSY